MPEQTSGAPRKTRPDMTGWLPIAVAVLLSCLVGMLWWTIDQREHASLQSKLNAEAQDLATHVDADLRTRIPPLQRMARECERRGTWSEEDFGREASAYLADTAGIQALAWADRNGAVRWLFPRLGNEQMQHLNLALEANRLAAMQTARKTRSLAMTAPGDLAVGGKGFLVYFPVLAGQEEIVGFLVAAFRIQAWLDYVFSIREHHGEISEYRVSVSLDGVPVFQQEGWDSLPSLDLNAWAETEIINHHHLVIHLRPTPLFLAHGKTLLPRLTAVFGLLFSVLLASVIHLLQKTGTAKKTLEAEIREHRKTEDKLQQAASRLALATEAGGIGVWTWDIATGALDWNERMYELFAISPYVTPTSEIWRSALHPADLPEVEALFRKAVAGKAVFNTEFRIIPASGPKRYLAAAAQVERGPAGKARRITGIIWDRTARKKAEETLKKSEEQVRLLLNSTAEAIYGIDLRGNCIFANQACARMLGYPAPEMLLGRNMHQLVHYAYPDGRPMAVTDCRIYKAFREGKGSHVGDEVLWRADGSSFPVEYWSYPQIVNGETVGAVVTFLDITDRKEAEERLRESEQRFRSLVETTSDWVWEIDKNGVYTYASPKVEDLLGYRPDEVIGKTPFEFMPPEEGSRVKALFLDIVKIQAPFSALENTNLRKDGGVVILESSGVPVFDRDGAFAGYRGIDRDISKRKQAEKTLAAEQQRLASILEGTNVGTWEWNVQTGETVFNERWAEIIGYTLAELAPVSIETWRQFTHPDDLARSNELLHRHFNKELPYYECEARMRHKNGDWVWVHDRGKVATWTADGKPLMVSGTHQDITARKLAEEEVRHLATHDILTDLPSLRLAKDQLTMALNLARRHKHLVAVMFIDLDGFKAINDTLGHDAGDQLLREVAQRLLSCARATDTAARIGGDEFLFIGNEIHRADNAAQIAEKILRAVAQPFFFKGGQQAAVGASIGIALFPEHSESMDQLIKLADEAMYRIKNTGKSGFAFATPR